MRTINKFIFLVMIFTFSSINSWANSEITYHGTIYNVFFHPLIVYPKLAFDRQNTHLTYMNDWFVTVNEFNRILLGLYDRGFVLVSLNDVFEEKKDAHGHLIIIRKKLIFPPGKKPLILSLDDYNFYKTMKLHGTVHRFWVDNQGQLVTVTERKQQAAIIRDDQEIPQLLEKFIHSHPDFSFHNARGIIGLTGYNGIFGYDTQQIHSANYKEQVMEAKKVVQKLKQMGWSFASHSYFHLGEDKQTEHNFEESEKRWLEEVGSIVGPTSNYIFPFGDSWDEDRIRMHFLTSLGYKYFFGVSQNNEVMIEPGYVVLERFPIDGLAVRGKYSKSKTFITPAKISCPSNHICRT